MNDVDVQYNDQLKMNKELQKALELEPIDFALIERLIRNGADPLGSANGNDPDEHIFGEYVNSCSIGPEDDIPYTLKMLPEVTAFLLEHGMTIKDDPAHPFDGNNINPVWYFVFCVSEYAARAMQMLLDHDLEVGLFEDFVDTLLMDLSYVGGYADGYDDKRLDADTDFKALWDTIFKMVFLGASYPYIIQNSDYLRKRLYCDCNRYDLTKFRLWNDFEYEYIKPKKLFPFGFVGTGIIIKEKATKKVVWEFEL